MIGQGEISRAYGQLCRYMENEVAVENSNAMLERSQPRPINQSSDRFQDLRSSFLMLRSNNRALVVQIRASLGQLRELRSKLRQLSGNSEAGQTANASDDQLMQKFGLTRREAQVARLLSAGGSNQRIAGELRISEHTARHHTQRILAKLAVHSRGEAGAKIRA
jgi:DNA-binding CsgD family transcriptional regulator